MDLKAYNLLQGLEESTQYTLIFKNYIMIQWHKFNFYYKGQKLNLSNWKQFFDSSNWYHHRVFSEKIAQSD